MYNSRAALDMAVILVILFSFVFQVICDDNMGKCINLNIKRGDSRGNKRYSIIYYMFGHQILCMTWLIA